MRDILLEAREISKSFGASKVLDRVSLSVRRGDIVALLGHNGSGKSTLVKILAGTYMHDDGDILRGSAGATRLHFIHQTLGLIPSLTVAENLDLGFAHLGFGLAPVRRRSERRRVQQMIATFGMTIDPDALVSGLTAAERTIVAIVRALAGWDGGDHVLVLDEPTAALHGDEIELLKSAVRNIAARGAGVIYISHRLGEAVELADRAIVLKSGKMIAEKARGEFDQASLVRLIAGGEPYKGVRRVRSQATIPGLHVKDLRGHSLRGVSFAAECGEILGVSGLVGSGMERLNGAIFGASAATSGVVLVRGAQLRLGSPQSAIRSGVAYVPADRRGRASIGHFSALENLTLARMSDLRRLWGALDRARERREAYVWMDRLQVRPAGQVDQMFDLFSGGNQQKIVLAKWLRIEPKLLLVDEPTQGVDAGAQAEIYGLLTKAARSGATVVVSSSDIKELAAICDRVLVLRDGVDSQEFSGAELSESALVAAVIDDSPHTKPDGGGDGRAFSTH
jgi:ABC-type sugar transport system ATPase subunit